MTKMKLNALDMSYTQILKITTHESWKDFVMAKLER